MHVWILAPVEWALFTNARFGVPMWPVRTYAATD